VVWPLKEIASCGVRTALSPQDPLISTAAAQIEWCGATYSLSLFFFFFFFFSLSLSPHRQVVPVAGHGTRSVQQHLLLHALLVPGAFRRSSLGAATPRTEEVRLLCDRHLDGQARTPLDRCARRHCCTGALVYDRLMAQIMMPSEFLQASEKVNCHIVMSRNS
jgi:hypothetical protein